MAVDSTRKEYAQRSDDWQTCRDVLEGSKAVKAQGTRYLPMLSAQNQNEYAAYVRRAKFFNGTARTREALVGTVFRKDPTIKVPDRMKAHLSDITLDGTPFNDFAEMAFKEVLGVGRVGILIDYPDVAKPVDATRGLNVKRTEDRPYWVLYKTEQIINWRETTVAGNTMLSMVVLKECAELQVDQFETKEIEQWRVLYLDEDGIYRIQLYRRGTDAAKTIIAEGAEMTPRRRGQPLTFIPFQFIGPSSLRATPEKPPLTDMATINLHMYITSADLEHGRHYTGLPQPWVAGVPADGGDMRIGSEVAWTLSEGGSAGYLEFTGQGLKALQEAIAECKEEMASLGAEMLVADETGEKDTATAARLKHSNRTASLKTMANRLSSGFTNLERMHSFWYGSSDTLLDEKVTCEFNTEFWAAKLTPDEAKTVLLWVQAGKMSLENGWYLLEKGEWTKPGRTLDDELLAIRSDVELENELYPPTDPMTGLPIDPNNPPTPAAKPASKAAA